MRRALSLLLLLGVMFTATGCIIIDRGPGPDRWCYYHPYRCY
ncbi:MAG TPA: hypothetical protein VE690_15535 [Rhodopila sp.]|jgi:hypothetical protein|nr:hypothetical protein [Rhodopila sp.]